MNHSDHIYARWIRMIESGLSELKVKRYAARWNWRMHKKGREFKLCFD